MIWGRTGWPSFKTKPKVKGRKTGAKCDPTSAQIGEVRRRSRRGKEFQELDNTRASKLVHCNNHERKPATTMPLTVNLSSSICLLINISQ